MERGRLVEAKDVVRFVLGGKSEFSIESQKTHKHYTYKVVKPQNGFSDDFIARELHFVYVMAGENQNYIYAGVIDVTPHIDHVPSLRLTAKSKFKYDSQVVQAFNYFSYQTRKKELPEIIHFYHEGKCCRCGRELTDPESIRRGMGPVCSEL